MGKLGYSSFTLTDITETIPVSLVLQTNLNTGLQTKNGSLYSPDFTKTGEELVITPSLFLGSTEIVVPIEGETGAIYYQITDEEEDGVEKNFFYNNTSSSDDIYVDEEGKLHYRKNLTSTIAIEAYINDYKNTEHGYTIEQVAASSPITVMLLEQGNNEYSIIISSADGREHFEENYSSPITLTATLYKGTTKITENIEYEWNKISEKDWKKTASSITIARADVSNVEAFQCDISLTDGSGLSFSAQKIIRDFTDGYTNQLVADGTLILTPKNTSVTLTNQVWYRTDIINNEENQTRFVYTWKLLTANNEEQSIENNLKVLTIDLNVSPFDTLRENFSILGMVEIDGKAFTANYADIKYQPVSYSVDVSPRSIFIPVNKEGSYQSDGFEAEVVFKLVDENKQFLTYDGASSSIEKDKYVSAIVQNEAGKWDYTLTISLTKNDKFFSATDSSKNISISYTYLGESFSETIQLIKNFAGADGAAGSPTYNIYLSNDYYLFAGGETAATAGQVAEFAINAYYGADSLHISKVVFENNNYTLNDMSLTVSNQDIGIEGLLLSYDAATQVFSLTTQGNGNFLTSPGSVKMVVSAEEQNFLVFFNYGINYNGNSYSLMPSENQIVYLLSQYKFNLSQVVLYSYYRAGGIGNNISYTDGYISYAIDGKNESVPTQGSTFSFDISKLNSTNSYVKFNLYKDSGKTQLLDTETIPVLTSYEGIEIGGENLIRWSKSLKTGAGKWSLESITTGKEGEFSTLIFNEGARCTTPKITRDDDWSSRNFVFSCLIKIEEIEGTFSFFFGGYEDVEPSDSNCYKEIATITQEGYESLSCDDNWENGKWMKVYKVFNYNSLPFEDYPYLALSFALEGEGNISIKQPKLEIGNIPTSWSASPYDVDYADIVGTNLSLANSYDIEIKESDPYLLFADEFIPTTKYTFSCAATEWNGDEEKTTFVCELVNDKDVGCLSFELNNNSQEKQSYTFSTPDEETNYHFHIYAASKEKTNTNGTLTITQAKIEKGNFATPFFITDDYVSSLIKELQEDVDSNTESIVIVQADGTELRQSIDAIEKTISTLNEKYVTVNDKEAIITAASSKAYSQIGENNIAYLKELAGYITIDANDATNPYIKIATKSSDNYFATKITNSQLGFYYNNEKNPVAYINKNMLGVNQAKFNETFSIGDLKVAITDSGVGFSW